MGHGQYRGWILLAALMFSSTAAACRCNLYGSSFVEIAGRSNTIVQATVESYGDTGKSMILRISRVLKGEGISETVKVWGDNGVQCRPYVTRFPLNTEWVFVLREPSKSMFNRPPLASATGEYWISICGANWLQVDGDKIRGRIIDRTLEQIFTGAELRDAIIPDMSLKQTQ